MLKKYDEVEIYFGVTYEEVKDDEYFFNLMIRIQCDYENGTMGKGIDYYASFYGY